MANVDGITSGEYLHIILTCIVGLCTAVTSVVGYLVKRAIGTVDSLAHEVQCQKLNVAILLDRDRRRRLADYDAEENRS